MEKYQEGLEEKMKKSNLVFNWVYTLHYELHRTSLDRGGSYIDYPEWLKNKKATINPKNKKKGKYFQYAVTVALNYKQIDNHAEEIYNISPYINTYDWNEIDFPSHKKD